MFIFFKIYEYLKSVNFRKRALGINALSDVYNLGKDVFFCFSRHIKINNA